MTTFVSMIRGINVAGHRPVRMDRLACLFVDMGFGKPRTYLQSGNVVFEAKGGARHDLAGAIERRILKDLGLEVSVALRTSAEMTGALAANPFARRPGIDPRFMYATFLISREGPGSLDAIALPVVPGEEAILIGSVVYLHCPFGFGGTKINNAFFERALRTRATTRNWQTVTALESMARGVPLG
jgi:uncharacterized protein (DUF1697 family)